MGWLGDSVAWDTTGEWMDGWVDGAMYGRLGGVEVERVGDI